MSGTDKSPDQPSHGGDSFLKDCFIISHPDQEGPTFVICGERVYARLQDMVIMPREQYEVLMVEVNGNGR